MDAAHHGLSPIFRPRNRRRWGWGRKALAALAITWLLLLFSYVLSFFAANEARDSSPTGTWLFRAMPD